MPFNDKGEFIRAIPEPPRARSSTRNRPISLRIPPPNAPRITTSADRPPQQQAPQPVHQSGSSGSDWTVVGVILLTLIGLAVLAGVVYLLIVYHRWVLMILSLWLINWVRKQ